MGQALYRKYRSKKFTEVVGQEHITATLEKAIKNGRISHAYLFTGPRGVGKTSVARILAHEVNNLPYRSDAIHLDIIEIDAASNRRIDEVRDLREKVHIAPTSAKFKVYIIDEVHMLTKEAFNALLKTLEEPPEHCIFILATTEAHKLPETIVSRTQRFSFKPIEPETAVKHLRSIAKNEKISIEPIALELLAKHGQGSFRDSISLLDQLSNFGKKIDETIIRQFLGLPAKERVKKLLLAVESGNSGDIIIQLDEFKEQGTNAAAIAKSMAEKLREQIIAGHPLKWQATLLKDLLEVQSSESPFEYLEVTLLSAASDNYASDEATNSQPVIKSKALEASSVKSITAKTNPEAQFDLSKWDDVLIKIRGEAASLYTALKLADPVNEDGTLVLNFKFPLHQKKINTSENKASIERIIKEVSGNNVKICCRVEKAHKPSLNENDRGSDVQTISNIFGTAEVLES